MTTVRDLATRLPKGTVRSLSDSLGAGGPPLPRILPHGAMLDGPPGAWPGIRVAASAAETRAEVRAVATEGWPTLKTYSLLRRYAYLAAADEAGALGLRVHGHVPKAVTLGEAVKAGHAGVDHLGRVTQACSDAEVKMVDANRRALASERPLEAFGRLWPIRIVLWTGALTAYRVLMVHVYEETGSLPVIQVMHASFTGSRGVLAPEAQPEGFLVWYGLFTALLGVGAAALIRRPSDS